MQDRLSQVRLAASAALLSMPLLAACGGDPELFAPPIDTDPYTSTDAQEEPTETLQAALADFGSCMSIEVWIKSGIYKLYKAKDLQNTQCQACHSDNTGGAALSEDVVWSFKKNQVLPSVMRLVTGTVDERGNFKTLVPSNRYIDKGIDPCLPGESCHPKYSLPAVMQRSVATFVEESLNRWKNDNCHAPYVPSED
ncbi:MAG: hypothetical protein VB934_02625 [Polyangiaceae bacterium]